MIVHPLEPRHNRLHRTTQRRHFLLDVDALPDDPQQVHLGARRKANANRILNASLTDKILQEKGIIATLQLAESPNTKVVIIGNSENGLPLILGDSK